MNIGMIIFFIVFALLLTIFVISITAFFLKRKYKEFKPQISILIPAYNEEKTIKRCIQAILTSNYDKNKLEIILGISESDVPDL